MIPFAEGFDQATGQVTDQATDQASDQASDQARGVIKSAGILTQHYAAIAVF